MDPWLIGLIIVALVVAPAIGGAFHSTEYANRFAKLGDIKGKPISEIVVVVGQPTSISAAADGTLYQWVRPVGFNGTHHAILVDSDGNAIGFMHQALV